MSLRVSLRTDDPYERASLSRGEQDLELREAAIVAGAHRRDQRDVVAALDAQWDQAVLQVLELLGCRHAFWELGGDARLEPRDEVLQIERAQEERRARRCRRASAPS